MIFLRLILFLALLAAASSAAPLDDPARHFLATYEQIRTALATDNLAAARTAAQTIPEAEPVAAAADLTSARKAFKVLSARAVGLARGQPGFFIAHCSMFPGGADWVQTSTELSNPYWGKAMPRCGAFVK
jgi:hypothetical protein